MTPARRFLQFDMDLESEIEISQVGGTSSEEDSSVISEEMFLLGTSDFSRTSVSSAGPFTNARTTVGDSNGSIPAHAHSSSPVTYARTTVGDSVGSTRSAVTSTIPLINARTTTIGDSTRPFTTGVGATSTAPFSSTRSIPPADNRTSAGGPTRPTLRINWRSGNATSQTRNVFRNQGRFFSDNRTSNRSDNRTSAAGPTRLIPRMNQRSRNGTSQTRNAFRNLMRYFSRRSLDASDPINDLLRTQDFAIELGLLCLRLQRQL